MKIKLWILVALLLPSITFAQGFMAVANISKISGAVYLNNQKARDGQEITEGMKIEVPKKSDYVEIKFQNGHLVHLAAVEIKVKTLNPKNTLLEISKGKLFAKIKALTPNETIQVKAKQTLFTADESQFMIEEDKKQTYLCVVEGKVTAKLAKSSVEVHRDEDVLIASGRDLKATLAAKSILKSARTTIESLH
jgi:hypothetical protein